MKKIIPITALVCAVITLAAALVGLVAVCVAAKVNEMTLFAVPVAIAALVISLLGGGISFLFKKDMLCKISAWTDLAAFVLSVVAIIVWQTAI